jgi:hypothetical protein
MKTTDLIKAYEYDNQNKVPSRGYLGMSGIGHDCSRKLWYDFRLCTFPDFDAITLLRFADGHASEALTAERIRLALPDIRPLAPEIIAYRSFERFFDPLFAVRCSLKNMNSPEPIMMKVPNHLDKFGKSPKINKPRMVALTISIY